MFVRVKKKDEMRWQITIVESIRTGKTVKQKTVRNVGTAYSEKEVEEFRKIGEAGIISIKNALKPVLPFADPVDFYAPKKRKKNIKKELVDINDLREEKRINEGFVDIFCDIFKESGLDKSINGTKNDKQWNDIIESTVIARIADPRSKRATISQLEDDFDIKIPFQKIYRAMDQLVKCELDVKSIVRKYTLGIFKEKVDVLFFDVTTLYFESITSDEIKDFGFSKDCKFKEVQVMLALITTKEGLPVTYKLFPGNTFEGNTLPQTIEEIRSDFDVSNFVFVADRGMFNEKNLQYMEENNISYIVAACLKKLPIKLKTEILSREFGPAIICDEFHWIDEFEHKDRRLIVSYSSKRAKKDASDRQRLIDRLLKKTKDKKIKVKDLIPNYGTKKFLQVTGGEAKVNEIKIAQDAEWDGLHGVITNQKNGPAAKILERYRGLWQIEEAFRVNKHSLKMRPIFHWTPKRIKAHILICFMSFALSKYSLYRMKQSGLNMSLEELRGNLDKVEASIVKDTKTKKRYIIPSKVTECIKKIYNAFGKKRDDTPYLI